MKVSVIGTGYVGLVTGACLAETGNHVLCLDVDAKKIKLLNQGKIPIYEPGLEDIVKRNMAAGNLRFTTNVEETTEHGLIQFIAVGTPPDEDGSADLQHVMRAAATIAQHMREYKLIVDKSTVPVGTADKVRDHVQQILNERKINIPFSVSSNPEFLKEGDAVNDFMRPERIVIGVDDVKAAELMRSLYLPFNRRSDRIIVMDTRSAEMTKYAANAMLATRISFMNELALLAEKMGVDIESVRHGIGSDSRIGNHFLYPGCGYGGSCFPKDVQALRLFAKTQGHDLKILDAVESVNNNQKGVLLEKIIAKFGNDLSSKNIALWGLAFKPETDDMREAPSRKLIEGLWSHGAAITAYDPAAMNEARRIFGNDPRLRLVDSPMSALQGADVLVIVTEWKIFRVADFETIKQTLRYPAIFDGRNLFKPSEVRAKGLEYFSIGRI
ncbi:MAG: UDP-glucose/GDP-mannose dehydrogenase family protein [Burkholderiales bacterium]|nr:UDP-glucose/GDP-mannose dehydrogenase family protein [Nitrosomonas sp.]MCP5274543.1 UDP-glucose/GDP-mannose dehydrogenase family protein [Burkholderiales bacterium]